jgi:hypothetical protein
VAGANLPSTASGFAFDVRFLRTSLRTVFAVGWSSRSAHQGCADRGVAVRLRTWVRGALARLGDRGQAAHLVGSVGTGAKPPQFISSDQIRQRGRCVRPG